MHLQSIRIILLRVGFGKIKGNKNYYVTKTSRPNTVPSKI